MKKLIILLAIVATMASCEGPTGPRGLDGEPGSIIASSAFEIEIDFNTANDFSHLESYGFEVLTSDVTLDYILWDVIEGKDIWRLLPQQVYFEEGPMQYNFDFTDVDVNIFLDATFPLELLTDDWTQNQVFRVVVIPADSRGRVDYTNYDAVMERFGIEETDFQKRY
jgi:hypothetical protein